MQFGLPPKPTPSEGQAAMQQWQNFMQHWKPVTPPQSLTGRWNIHHPIPTVPLSNTTTTSNTTFTTNNIWSGYLADSSYNEWNGVSGEYFQPAYHYTPVSPTYESSWVGLGGYGSPNLLQCGTHMDSSGSYYAWFEAIVNNSGPEVTLPSVVVHPGDLIKDYVYYNSSNGETNFVVTDYSDNTSGGSVGGTSAYYDGTHAEFIDESASFSGSQGLSNFQTISWSDSQVHSIYNYWNPIGALTNTALSMSGSHGNTTIGSLSSNYDFNDTWVSAN